MSPSPPPPPPHPDTSRNAPAADTASRCALLLPSALRHLPFPPPRPASPKPGSVDRAAQVAALASTAERFFRALGAAAAEHPLLKPVICLSSELRSFCEIHGRATRVSNSLSVHSFAAILPGDSVAGLVVANGITNFLNIYNSLLVVRLVLTWFPNSPPAIVAPLSTLCDPYLNIFRGIIPPLGGSLDLSPILAFLVLNAFTSTAAALPAELPTAKSSPRDASSPSMLSNFTAAQEKWMKRVCRKRLDSSG